MAFGLGILVGMILEKGLLCFCCAFGMMILGFCVLQQR